MASGREVEVALSAVLVVVVVLRGGGPAPDVCGVGGGRSEVGGVSYGQERWKGKVSGEEGELDGGGA